MIDIIMFAAMTFIATPLILIGIDTTYGPTIIRCLRRQQGVWFIVAGAIIWLITCGWLVAWPYRNGLM